MLCVCVVKRVDNITSFFEMQSLGWCLEFCNGKRLCIGRCIGFGTGYCV